MDISKEIIAMANDKWVSLLRLALAQTKNELGVEDNDLLREMIERMVEDSADGDS